MAPTLTPPIINGRYENSSLRVTALTIRSGQRLPVERWGMVSILIVLSGSVAENHGSHVEVLPRDMIAIRPTRLLLPLDGIPAGAKLVALRYRQDALDALGDAARYLDRASTMRGRSSVELAWRIAGELRSPDALSQAAVPMLAQGILIGCTRYHLHRALRLNPRAMTARRILDERYADPPTTRELAADVGCTPEHLTRMFRVAFGFTIRGWIRRRRVERAKQLLVQTRCPIGQIAEQLGFADTAHFARTFRRATTLSPGEFRTVQGGINPVLKATR
jgi:AraC-like DNA-binding protein